MSSVPDTPALPALFRELARRQDGLVSRRQLERLGLTDRQIDGRLATGGFERLHAGVYRINGAPDTYQQRIRASTLAIGGNGASSHRAAAVLWGVGYPGRDRWLDDQPIDVTVPYSSKYDVTGVHVHRSLDLTPEQITTRHGIAVTNPLRLVVDLGAVAPWWVVESVLERLVERRLVTPLAARTALAQLSRRGRRGCGVLRRVLDQRGLGQQLSDSPLEALFANLGRNHGLPEMTYQFWITTPVGRRRIDFCYPELRLAIEVDGYETHSGRQAFQDDRARDVELAALGWQTIRFTWHDVVFRPAWVAARLRAVIGVRRTQLDPTA